MKRSLIHTSLALGLGITLTLLLLWALQQPPEVRAAPLVTRYVATTGIDSGSCTTPASPCRTIQYAVDQAADGDEILIAAGVYTSGGTGEVVYIAYKSLALRGGYTTTNNFAGPADPQANPTILDGQATAQVARLRGQSSAPISPTLEGLRLANGTVGVSAQYAATVISGCHVYGNGGGIRLVTSGGATLTNNQIYSNSATYGGGIYIERSDGVTLEGNYLYNNTATTGAGIRVSAASEAILVGNHIYSNTATSSGGGLNASSLFTATLEGNFIYSNTAAFSGGGLYLYESHGTSLMENDIYGNSVDFFGGALYLQNSDDVTLSGNTVRGNTARGGGGLYIYLDDDIVMTGNTIYSNTANQSGGGMNLTACPNVSLVSNQVYSNTADNGGGLYITDSPTATLASNHVYSNTASYGGGLFFDDCPGSILTNNEFHYNKAWEGGGVNLYSGSDITLKGNWIYGNAAEGNGGGVQISNYTDVTLANNVVADNRLTGSGDGAGVLIGNSDVQLLHTTLARNTGSDGNGVYVTGWMGEHSVVTLTNTILVSHTVGVYATDGNTATLEATLWGTGVWANGQDTDGAGTVISSTNVSGDPGFVDYTNGDYHITGASAARNAGVDAGVLDDIDGDSRLFAPPPDLGADEIVCLARINDGPTEYTSVQVAVDAATDGDTVKVAGTCRGVETRDIFTQLALVTESLTIRGGYSSDFASWDPELFPTTLDAQREGRVLRLSGSMDVQITPTLESLHITHGYISGDSGGGIYSIYANTTISSCHIYENETSITGGGGILFYGDGITLTNNHIYSNTAGNSAGGVYSTDISNMTLTNNWIYGNQAKFSGGIYIKDGSNVVMVNNVVVDNQISSIWGAGIRLRNTDAHLLHTTIARNRGSAGEGIYVSHGSSVWLTNAILVSQTVGVYVSSDSAVEFRNTLWGTGAWANGQDWAGDGSIIKNGSVNGDPGFVDYTSGDYHITAASDALDQGVVTWVSTDIDGHQRNVGAPDLGADEVMPVLEIIKGGPAKVNEGTPITYTLRITNTSVSPVEDVLLTDTLPSGASFVSASNGGSEAGGVVSWPTFDVPPGAVVRTFIVTATDTITNDDYVATPQIGLPAVGSIAIRTTINHAPVADAGAPQTVHTGTVTLDGSDTYDPDGGDMWHWWQQIGGPTSVAISCPDCRTTTFDAPLLAGTYVFSFTVTDLDGLSDTDTTTVTITLPDLTIAKSGPSEVEPGALITYTLVVTNSGTAAATSLVITDTLPSGATFVAASDGGLLVGNTVSWSVPSLDADGVVTLTLAITSLETITNDDYRVSCAEGISAIGSTSVTTEVTDRVYLPLVIK